MTSMGARASRMVRTRRILGLEAVTVSELLGGGA